MNKDCKKKRPFRVRLQAEKEKKLPTVKVGLFSVREKTPTKKTLFVKTSPSRRQKRRIVPKKTQRADILVCPLLLEAKESLWFSARDRQTFAKLWDPTNRVRNEGLDNSSIASIILFRIFPSFSPKAIVYQVATVI